MSACAFFCWFFFAEGSSGGGGGEKNRKRDIRDGYTYNQRYREERYEMKNTNALRRGDIPILSGDCDGKGLAWVVACGVG